MTISSQDYAALSDDAYKDRAVGRRKPGAEEEVIINGVKYAVLDHVSNRLNGYQGTVYQRRDSGEIVVAHRGTEQIIRDGVITDGAMVFNRTNPQAQDALALTRRYVEYAAVIGKRDGHAPEVTVTGHSLGGTLAQVSAHHFDLEGETFNAYGASSLGYRIPEGGDRVLNHVMAADPVSAASPHYGQVRVYATPGEIRTLGAAGFSNSRLNGLIPDSPVAAAGFSLGSHKLGNFLGESSVLKDPHARELADRNRRMIDEYRDDLREIRRGTTVIGRGPLGNAIDVIDELRGPLKPGEPAARDAGSRLRSDAGALRIDQPGHAGYPLFLDAQRGVQAQDARVGRAPDAYSDQLAGSLAAAMHAAGGRRIDTVAMNPDASRTFAVQGRSDDPAQLRVGVDTVPAMNAPLERSGERVLEQAAAQARVQAHEQGQQQERQQIAARALG